jgi:hypothetical protein
MNTETPNILVRTVVLTIVFSLYAFSNYAQNNATEGKEFYVAFTSNRDASTVYNPQCYIRYVVTDTCYITAQYKNGDYIDNNTLYPPGIYTIGVDTIKCYIQTTSSGIKNKGIKVTSTKDIGLYAFNTMIHSFDATAVLPTTSLGNHYTIISHTSYYNKNILIIAPSAGTKFTIRDANGAYVVRDQSLSANTTYLYTSLSELTGYTVESNNNIAVFSTVDCGGGVGYITPGGCDHNFEQMLPTNTAGKNFLLWQITPPVAYDEDIIKILALEDGTQIKTKGTTYNPSISETIFLNAHETSEFNLYSRNVFVNESSRVVALESNKPIIVEHISGYAPSIQWWIPTEQMITRAMTSPFKINYFESHTLHIMIPAGSESDMIMKETRNGITTAATLPFFTNQADTNYVIAKKTYQSSDSEVLIELINPAGLIAYMYAKGDMMSDASYIYPAGMGAFNLQNYFTAGTKTLPYKDVYYSETTDSTHTFAPEDNITVKRTIQSPFQEIKWLINGKPYTSITDNKNTTNTLTFPAAKLECGENSISMSVLYNGATADSVYTGKVWMSPPVPAVGTIPTLCPDTTFSITVKSPQEGYCYKVYDASTDGTHLYSSSVDEGTLSDLPVPENSTTYYITTVSPDGCESARTAIPITVNAMQNYADIRVSACPEIENISLSKYTDTIKDMSGVHWSSQISGMPIMPDGTVSTASLFPSVYTFTYAVDGTCGQQQKVYLEILKNNRIREHKDTVVMCYLHAGAVQINQIFGIEAKGNWSPPYPDITSHINYTSYGSMIMNGKEIYEDEDVLTCDYHGVNAKMIEFKYQCNGCLNDKEYPIVIILTSN